MTSSSKRICNKCKKIIGEFQTKLRKEGTDDYYHYGCVEIYDF